MSHAGSYAPPELEAHAIARAGSDYAQVLSALNESPSTLARLCVGLTCAASVCVSVLLTRAGFADTTTMFAAGLGLAGGVAAFFALEVRALHRRVDAVIYLVRTDSGDGDSA